MALSRLRIYGQPMRLKISKLFWIILCATFLVGCVIFVSTLPEIEAGSAPPVLTAEDMSLLERTYVKPVDIVDVRQRI